MAAAPTGVTLPRPGPGPLRAQWNPAGPLFCVARVDVEDAVKVRLSGRLVGIPVERRRVGAQDVLVFTVPQATWQKAARTPSRREFAEYVRSVGVEEDEFERYASPKVEREKFRRALQLVRIEVVLKPDGTLPLAAANLAFAEGE